jgi:glycerol-3-phosphate acyltransferase PlsY
VIAEVVVTGALGYLLGSLPWGVIVSRAYRGIDIRDYGSGKTGFTNTLRSLGLGAALIVLGLDVAKGAAPVLVGRFVFDEPWAAAVGGLMAVFGHTWPVFAGFRGGRGVATAFGAFIAVAPIAALPLALLAAVVLGTTRYVSLMSVTGVAAGFIGLVVLIIAGRVPAEYLLFGAAVTASVELSHLGNIRRLIAGTEPKLGQGGAPRQAPDPSA